MVFKVETARASQANGDVDEGNARQLKRNKLLLLLLLSCLNKNI